MKTQTDSSLLIVDDEEAIRTVLTRTLKRAGYLDVTTAASSEEARQLLTSETIDLVVTDMQMPGGSGLELLEYIHNVLPGIATMMITVVDDPLLADRALDIGAYGYIIKPFRQSEVLIGVSNALRRRHLELENQNHRDHLEEAVKTRTQDLWETIMKLEQSEQSVKASRAETMARLAVAGEFHDDETGFHVTRMSRYCEVLARECRDEKLTSLIREASSLHDVGKLGVPDHILLKMGDLSAEERRIMQKHAETGYRILKDSQGPLLRLAAEIALTHHEWMDGSGYPNGLVGHAIPLSGRIAAIADVFDALTNNRAYRVAFPLLEAVEMMKEEAGTHFDPDLLTAFWEVLPEILQVAHEYRSVDLAASA